MSRALEAGSNSTVLLLFTTAPSKVTNTQFSSVEIAGFGTKIVRLQTHDIPRQDPLLCVNGPPKTVFFRGKTQLRPTVIRLMCPSTFVHRPKTFQVS